MRQPYIFRGTGNSDNGAYAYIDLPRLTPGQVLLVREAIAWNASGAAINIQPLLNRTGANRPYGSYQSPADGKMVTWSMYTMFREGDVFSFRSDGGTGYGAWGVQVSGWLCTEEPEIIVVAEKKPPAA